MGADLDIIIEHRMATDTSPPRRVWQWGLVEAQFAFYRGGDVAECIREGLPEQRASDVETTLIENFWGHLYASDDKRQTRSVWLPRDVNPTTVKLLAEEAFEAYWIRVADGRWFVEFVSRSSTMPDSLVKLSTLVSSLLALGHDVRLYMSYGQ
jgi:hypothetical protein